MKQGNDGMRAGDWPAAIGAYGLAMLQQPALGRHYVANLQRAARRYRQERLRRHGQPPSPPTVVVAAAELSHNSAGRAYLLAQLHQQLGSPVTLLGSHFLPFGRDLWEPIRQTSLPIASFVVEDESRFVYQAAQLVLSHPADLVHLSKPRLPTVIFGLLYQLFWGASVLMDSDDEELLFGDEQQPIPADVLPQPGEAFPAARQLMGPRWTRWGVMLGRRFDGLTVANRALQQRYGGSVIRHARDASLLRPATAEQRLAARWRHQIAPTARVLLFFGSPKRHKGLLEIARAMAQLPAALEPLFLVVGDVEEADLRRELIAALPCDRLKMLANQPLSAAAEILSLANGVALLSHGPIADFQTPAKLSDALAMGLPVLASPTLPIQELAAGEVIQMVTSEDLASQLRRLLEAGDHGAEAHRSAQARSFFEANLSMAVVSQHLQAVIAAVNSQQTLTQARPAAEGLRLLQHVLLA